MIKVNLHNYEAFALDYIEGRLSDNDLSAFISFLDNHPEIKIEIESLTSEIMGFENNDEFSNKTDIKKEALLSEDINTNNYQTYFVAFHEGDLSDHTQEKVLKFVNQHADKSAEFVSFANLKFTPDRSIHFPLKRQVKRSTPVIILYRGLRIAASVVIILGIAWYFSLMNKPNQQYTQRTKVTEINQISETESDQVSELGTTNDLVQQLKEDAIVISNRSKQPTDLIVQKENQPMEEPTFERNNYLSMASTTIQSATIEQNINSDLKIEPIQEQVDLVAEDENIFKIKLPKLFKKSDKQDSNEESTTLAKARINIKKKNEDPDQKTYVDLGPFKVYKKKGDIANASNLNGSKDGL